MRKIKKESILYMFILFALYTASFCSFSFTSSAKVEHLANKISAISSKMSTNGCTNISFKNNNSVEFNDIFSTTYKTLQENYYKTAGSFYNYRTVLDANYDNFIEVKELQNESVSALLHTNGSGTHKNANNENVYDWFEIKLMFEKVHEKNTNDLSYVLIRQTMADKILEARGYLKNEEDEYNLGDYEKIVGTSLECAYKFNNSNTSCSWTIGNIILDHEGYDNYYNEVFGNYITICIYHKNALPSFDGYSVNFDFGASTIDTVKYINRINEDYINANTTVNINKRNLKENKISDETLSYVSENFHIKNKNDYWFLVCSLASISIIFMTLYHYAFSKRTTLLYIIFPFVFSYCLFFIISTLFKFDLVFSTLAIACNLSILCIGLILYFSQTGINKKEINNFLFNKSSQIEDIDV